MDYIFGSFIAEGWHYTKLLFRLLRNLFGATIWLTAYIRNRNQNIPKVSKSDLFDKEQQ